MVICTAYSRLIFIYYIATVLADAESVNESVFNETSLFASQKYVDCVEERS